MLESQQLKSMAILMKRAYERGENVMEFARNTFGESANTPLITLLAYDLQAGNYVKEARANPGYRSLWCKQIANLLEPFIRSQDSLLEVGCGEATTLAGVLEVLPNKPHAAFGFDISWSRCAHGNEWLREKGVNAQLFVADLFNIPLADRSVDVVYTSHSLEPNGGREREAIRELMRIARKAIVLVEPGFEFASDEARKRMKSHGYVQDLRKTAEQLGGKIVKHKLLKVNGNPLNPSAVISIVKDSYGPTYTQPWRCPITQLPMSPEHEAYVVQEAGLLYPVLRGIPLLRVEHAVVASAFNSFGTTNVDK